MRQPHPFRPILPQFLDRLLGGFELSEEPRDVVPGVGLWIAVRGHALDAFHLTCVPERGGEVLGELAGGD